MPFVIAGIAVLTNFHVTELESQRDMAAFKSTVDRALQSSETFIARIVNTVPNPRQSTSRSDVITCELSDGSVRQYLVKYLRDHRGPSHGHRHGGAYEALVYRTLLEPLGHRPEFIGSWQRDDSETCLILEYDSRAVRVSAVARDSPGVVDAAAWLGAFHRTMGHWVRDHELSCLTEYDPAYLVGWSRRTEQYAAHLTEHAPWLRRVTRSFERHCLELLGGSQTVIHGEFVMANILNSDDSVFVVDWESAAISAGEIDVAALVDGWGEAVVGACVDAYVRARWDGIAPDRFVRRLDLARAYWQLRWLGDREEWTRHPATARRFRALRDLGRSLGWTAHQNQ